MTNDHDDPTGTAFPIVQVGDPVLRKACVPVTSFDATLADLVADMFASMYEAEGVGLAANQIGIPLRVFVYDCADDDDVRHVGHIVNPTLAELPPDRRQLDDSSEGCLSVPGPHHEPGGQRDEQHRQGVVGGERPQVQGRAGDSEECGREERGPAPVQPGGR